MTITTVNTTRTMLGLSSDSKPTTGVEVGARFYETDTLTWYIFSGAAWSLMAPDEYDAGLPAIGILRVAAAAKDAETVSIGADVYEVDTSVASHITAGNIRLDLSGGATRFASGTLTSANTGAFTAGKKVAIGAKVYTFRATIDGTSVDGDVLAGANGDAGLTNLMNAINLGTGAGTTYATAMTVNAARVASGALTNHTLVIAALDGGTAGNSIAFSTDEPKLSVDAATLGTTQAGVDPTAGDFTTALNTAINASGTVAVTGVRISANEVLIYTSTGVGTATAVASTATTALAETLAGTNNAWDTAALRTGKAVGLRKTANIVRTPNAAEVALATFHAVLPFVPTVVIVEVRDSTGAIKVITDTITSTANRIDIASAGSTHLAATDTVTIIATT